MIGIMSLGSMLLKAQIYMGKTCDISFFSKGPIEDIYAINKSTKPILNTANNEVAIKITIKGFVFDDKLMEEHFNEKYLESDKYPYAIFKGKINEEIEDYKKDGTHNVTITGKLNLHGVEKEITINAVATIKDRIINFDTKFFIALKDYNIEIPTLVAQNIAEQIDVTVKGALAEFKK
jgi:polyisoprenoid-binding protein YceI